MDDGDKIVLIWLPPEPLPVLQAGAMLPAKIYTPGLGHLFQGIYNNVPKSPRRVPKNFG